MSQPVDRVRCLRRQQEVRARRRIVMRLGFLAIVAASATACIFDQSDYKGGGRLDKGATAKTAEPPVPTSSGSTQPTSTSAPDAYAPD